jgi:hypothetical protein
VYWYGSGFGKTVAWIASTSSRELRDVAADADEEDALAVLGDAEHVGVEELGGDDVAALRRTRRIALK